MALWGVCYFAAGAAAMTLPAARHENQKNSKWQHVALPPPDNLTVRRRRNLGTSTSINRKVATQPTLYSISPPSPSPINHPRSHQSKTLKKIEERSASFIKIISSKFRSVVAFPRPKSESLRSFFAKRGFLRFARFLTPTRPTPARPRSHEVTDSDSEDRSSASHLPLP